MLHYQIKYSIKKKDITLTYTIITQYCKVKVSEDYIYEFYQYINTNNFKKLEQYNINLSYAMSIDDVVFMYKD